VSLNNTQLSISLSLRSSWYYPPSAPRSSKSYILFNYLKQKNCLCFLSLTCITLLTPKWTLQIIKHHKAQFPLPSFHFMSLILNSPQHPTIHLHQNEWYLGLWRRCLWVLPSYGQPSPTGPHTGTILVLPSLHLQFPLQPCIFYYLEGGVKFSVKCR
jgi:hypothetical protein